MLLIDCRNYPSIKINRNEMTYELCEDGDPCAQYITTENELHCPVNTNYCYIGVAEHPDDGTKYIYCKCVDEPVKFDILCGMDDVAELAFNAEIIPTNLHFYGSVKINV